MSLQVRFFAGAAAAAGCDEVQLTDLPPDLTLREVANLASSGEATRVLEACSFLVNGQFQAPDTPAANLPAAAVVDVLPPFAGG